MHLLRHPIRLRQSSHLLDSQPFRRSYGLYAGNVDKSDGSFNVGEGKISFSIIRYRMRKSRRGWLR